jgi:hypothetical protein
VKNVNLSQAVNSDQPDEVARAIMEVLIDADQESLIEIAADFVEDEIGHYDWVNNWRVVKGREDVVAKVAGYLREYSLPGDPQEIVNIIDRMASDNPGRWK